MITAGEVQFVKELIYELSALADPSEYIEREVQDAYTILAKLTEYNFEQTVNIYTQLKELEENGDD